MLKANRTTLLATAMFLFGILGALVNITHDSLWNDEACTALLMRDSLPELLGDLKQDAHPPLYFVGLKAFTALFGPSLLTMRIFSVLGLVALALLGLGPVRRLMGNTSGILFSFLCFFLPVSVSFAQEARMYTWACFFITGMVLYGYSAATTHARKDWLAYTAFALAAMYTHVYGLIVFLAFSSLQVLRLLSCKKALMPAFLVHSGIIVAGYAPWLHVTVSQALRASESPWYVKTSIPQVVAPLLIPLTDRFLIVNFVPAFLLTLLLSYYLFFKGVRRGWAISKESLSVMAFGTILITFLAAVAVSVLITPVLMPRYAFTVFGLFLIVCIAGLQGMKWSRLGTILSAVFMALFIPERIHVHANRVNGPIPEVQAYLKSRADSSQVFLHGNEHTFTTFCWYFPLNDHYLYEPNTSDSIRRFTKNGFRINDLSSVLANNSDIWVANKIGTHISRHVSGLPLTIDTLPESQGFIRTARSDTFKTVPAWYPGKTYSRFEMNPFWFQIQMSRFQRIECGKQQDALR